MTAADERFTGPFAAGPPEPALRIVAPSLTRFGWREVARAIEVGWTFAVVVAWAVLRRD